jgi:uncharacterized membrane protein
MRIMRVGLCLAAALVFWSLRVETSLAADSYTLTTIEYPGEGVWATFTTGINDRGDVVGGYIIPPTRHALLIRQGTFIELPLSGVGGCNDRGDLVGGYTDEEGIAQVYLARGGDYKLLTIFNVFGSDYAQPRDVNESGTVVGFWHRLEDDTYQGFVWDKGEISEISIPGATNTYITGINARGDMVGLWEDADMNRYGFALLHGQFIDLDALFKTHLEPYGINDIGQIVGTYDRSGTAHGLLLSGGTITEIDYPGATGTVVLGINSAGQIVGNYRGAYPDGHMATHGFLGQPGNKKKP